jgi:RHS repeat-associated protein
MVTSVTPVPEQQHRPRAQARAGGQDVHVRFDFGAYLDPSTSTTQLANETPDQSHVAARNRAGEYCCNQQYSVTAITTSTGTIAERFAYSAYGQPTILDASGSALSTSSISNRYTYTGREWDATLGLHHFRARWMSPSAGRFLSRDPIGFRGSGWGLYEFVHGRTLLRVDPSGLLPIDCDCACRFIPADGSNQHIEHDVVTVDCQGDGDACCRRACKYLTIGQGDEPTIDCEFSGEWHIQGAEDSQGPTGEEIDAVIDTTDNVVCAIFIVADVLTVPSGEGAAGCVATKTVTRTIKRCIKEAPKKTPKTPRCARLKSAKEAACGIASAMGGCGDPPNYGGLSNNDCHLREMAWGACATAREAFQKGCFKKGDKGWGGHMHQIGIAKAAARKCGACASRP